MLVAAAVLPAAPALLPGVTGSPIAEIEQLRARAAAAVRWVLDARPERVVAVCCAATSRGWTGGDSDAAAGFTGRPGAAFPAGLAVIQAVTPPGTALELHTVRAAATRAETQDLGAQLAAQAPRVGLIVAGDGSARRGTKAPGYLDERAAAFDERVEQALAGGDCAALLELDPVLAADLLVEGRAAWQLLAGACADRRVGAQLDYAGDPFGVRYLVARWAVD